MKRSGKVTFVVVALLIFAFAYVSFFGVSNYYGDTKHIIFKGTEDIRWGIDIQGGVETIFTPDVAEDEVSGITAADMTAAETIITNRLVNKNITNYEIYTDNENHQIIVRFPWQSDNENYDPQQEVKDLGETALVTFRKGQQDADGDIILQGAADVESASASYDAEQGYYVALNLTSEGSTKFATATAELQGQYISIYMDDNCISAPRVNSAITNGQAMITGMTSAEDAKALADKINAGSLPFALTIDDTIRVINPTLGEASLSVMLLAGIIAFAAIVIIMIVKYRVPGFVACIALLGQIAGMLACTSGFFSGVDSFTLTIPGIAGIILSIGMGVDANVLTSEFIREELRHNNKTIDGAIDAGYAHAFSAIFDGNVTNIIVAILLMGIFGPSDGLWAKIFYPILWVYNHTIGLIPGLSVANSITGSIYSFGYTLLIGVIFNFVMGVFASRVMLKGISRFKFLRKPTLYGGVKTDE